MPKLIHRTPAYTKHRASGQAVVRLDGKQFYLGPHGTKASRAEYDRLCGEWLANGRSLPRTGSGLPPLTVSELVAKYVPFAETYYDGRTDGVKIACRWLRTTYGKTVAEDFGPLALQSLTRQMIASDLSRSYVVDLVSRIRRLFRWAVAQQFVPVTTYDALRCVVGPRKGKGEAREAKPVEPVDDATVDATLPYLPSTLADMVRIHRLLGCRPTELCIMRPGDVDRSCPVWSYVPQHHKTEHHGHVRKIFIGPKAQAILLPYLDRDASAYCFVPSEVVARQNAERLKNADTAKRRRARKPRRAPGECYTEDSYRRAITRACEQAFRMPDELRRAPKEEKPEAKLQRLSDASAWRSRMVWHPNQLRHTAATEIRKLHGLEAAACTLGHSKVSTTELYAQRNFLLAERVAADR